MRYLLALMSCCLLCCVSCVKYDPEAVPTVPVTRQATPLPDGSSLRERAVALYEARQSEDWETIHGLLDPSHLNGATASEFAAWAEEEEPFRIHDFEVGQVLTDGEQGWVEMNCRVSMRRFPKLPARDVERWDKWHVVDGRWCPVPREQLESYPQSPAVRDAAEEAALAARFEASWEARQRRDWDRLYELSDPGDRSLIPLEQYTASHGLTEYLSHQVQWVEVVGDRGQVRVSITHKLTDPNLTKLPPREVVLTEQWTKVNGQWYLDLKPDQG